MYKRNSFSDVNETFASAASAARNLKKFMSKIQKMKIVFPNRKYSDDETTCKNKTNPDTSTNFTDCNEMNNYINEKICKRQFNPDTNTNFTNCEERDNLFCTKVMNDYSKDAEITESITEVGCDGYSEYYNKESCKKALDEINPNITKLINPDQYCDEYNCTKTTDPENNNEQIYDNTSDTLPCTQEANYRLQANSGGTFQKQTFNVEINKKAMSERARKYFPEIEILTNKEVVSKVPKVIVEKIEKKIPGFSTLGQGQGQGFIQDPRIEKYTDDEDVVDDVELNDEQKNAITNFCENNPGEVIIPFTNCPDGTKHKSKLGIILGASIGGSILLALILYLVISRRRN